jgi:hypothetical protein
MGNRGHPEKMTKTPPQQAVPDERLPAPSASYRRRAWVEFQRALDPLAPIKPLPPQPRA